MSHRYDASTKYLLEARLADWLPLIGRTTTAPMRVVDADLSTVTAAADRVLLVEEDRPWVLHVELQSGRDALLPARAQMYNTLIAWRRRLSVQTLIVVLRPDADGAELTGFFERRLLDATPYLAFHYQVVRVWQLPVETLLEGGLGLVPLAPLGAVAKNELSAVVAHMRRRIEREAAADEAATLWTAVDVLMGLRSPKDLVSELLRGVTTMKESVTYQAIVEEGVEKGRLEEARQMILDLGADRFGQPSEEVEQSIGHITDLQRLRWLRRQLLRVETWQELLAAR